MVHARKALLACQIWYQRLQQGGGTARHSLPLVELLLAHEPDGIHFSPQGTALVGAGHQAPANPHSPAPTPAHSPDPGAMGTSATRYGL